jgi:hypothetical protein
MLAIDLHHAFVDRAECRLAGEVLDGLHDELAKAFRNAFVVHPQIVPGESENAGSNRAASLPVRSAVPR